MLADAKLMENMTADRVPTLKPECTFHQSENFSELVTACRRCATGIVARNIGLQPVRPACCCLRENQAGVPVCRTDRNIYFSALRICAARRSGEPIARLITFRSTPNCADAVPSESSCVILTLNVKCESNIFRFNPEHRDVEEALAFE